MEARIFGLGMSAVEDGAGNLRVSISNPAAERTVEIDLTPREAELLADWRVPAETAMRKAG